MKVGAGPLEPFIRDQLHIEGFWDGLGFGWLAAAVILSGSPVAAMAVTLQNIQAIDPLSSFGMINGSRMGAAFVILLLGYIYSLRGKDHRGTGMSVGLLSLLVAQSVQIPAMLIGVIFLQTGTFSSLRLNQDVQNMTAMMENSFFDPVVSLLQRALPDWTLFFIGLGVIILSFRLFDRTVPHHLPESVETDRYTSLLYRPLVMFALGLVVTFFTMSVSVSLGLLVPLSAKDLIRREHIVPYIMGAGISTFVDTLAAALILQDGAVTIVVITEMMSILLVSLVYITIGFTQYQHTMLGIEAFLSNHKRALGLYLLAFVAVPLTLIFI